MWPLWEREIDLLATQRRTVLFAELTVTSHPLLYLCTFHLTWSADLLRSLIRVNILLAEIFRASSPRKLETFNRTSGLQISLALGLQKLQVLNVGDVHQNFCLQNLQVLDQKHNLQRLGLVHQNFLSRVFRSFLANLQNMLTLMIFWSEPRLQKRFEYSFACACNFWLGDFCFRVRICLSTQHKR